MKLIAFGDSFTAGDWDGENHREISYVARLCEIPGSIFDSWENHARGGYSNVQIAFSVYKYLQENRHNLADKFFHIGWTSHGRYSTANVHHEDSRRNYTAHDVYDFVSHPDKYPMSTQVLIYETDMAIMGIHFLLHSMNVSFSMIQAFDDHTGHPWSTTRNLPNWINGDRVNNTLMHLVAGHYLDESFETLPPNSQYFEHNWISKLKPNAYMASCWHPNESGHVLIADTLYQYLLEHAARPKHAPFV